MRTFESLLQDYSRIELLEYQIVVGGDVWIVLLGYPKLDAIEPKSIIYKLILKAPQSITFENINTPTEALSSVRTNMAADGVTVELKFVDGALINIICSEIVWI